MATERQIIANRRNAEKSTGPRSADGKARSRHNALTHGLTAQQVVLSHEDPDDFEALREAIFTSLAPDDVLQDELVERAASLVWRLRRMPAFEVALFEYVKYDQCRYRSDLDTDSDSSATQEVLEVGRTFEALLKKDLTGKLGRYETTFQRQLSVTLKDLRELQANRPDLSKLIDVPEQNVAPEPATLSDQEAVTAPISRIQRTPPARAEFDVSSEPIKTNLPGAFSRIRRDN